MREGCCRPHGWRANNETEFEIKNTEKAENCAYEKSQAREIGLMQVLFNIPGPLREFTGNQSAVRVEAEAGANLLQVLQALFVVYPGLRYIVLTKARSEERRVGKECRSGWAV